MAKAKPDSLKAKPNSLKAKPNSLINHNKFTKLIVVVLIFIVLSSKHILLFNEETLVALSFMCFMFCSYHYLSDTVSDSLNERSNIIREELQTFLKLKEELTIELIKEHKKQIELNRLMQEVSAFSCSEVITVVTQRESALKSIFTLQIQTKLKTLILSQIVLQHKLQKRMTNNFRKSVFTTFGSRRNITLKKFIKYRRRKRKKKKRKARKSRKLQKILTSRALVRLQSSKD